MICLSQSPLPYTTTRTRGRHSCPRRDSNADPHHRQLGYWERRELTHDVAVGMRALGG
jgi:hypothetical protein